jgi:hypothetical protein
MAVFRGEERANTQTRRERRVQGGWGSVNQKKTVNSLRREERKKDMNGGAIKR